MTIDLVARQDAIAKTIRHFSPLPYKWGENDCVHVVAHCFRELSLPDPLAIQARNYTTAFGAVRALRASGLKSLEEYLDAHFERIAPLQALAGDVVTYDDPNDPNYDYSQLRALTLCIGGGKALGYAYDGGPLVHFPVNLGAVAWRVSDQPPAAPVAPTPAAEPLPYEPLTIEDDDDAPGWTPEAVDEFIGKLAPPSDAGSEG